MASASSTKRLCSVEGCDQPFLAHGWCSLHYQRWYKRGDPLFVQPGHAPRTCSVDGCVRPVRAGGWCSKHYQRWFMYGDPLFTKNAEVIKGDLVATYWSRVDKAGVAPASCPELGPCWLWTACKDNTGYGQMYWGDRKYRAHIIAWFLATGHWPNGLETCHKCDVPGCVRFEHLFLGTHAQNMADMATKGRGNQPRGERCRHAKLTTDQVRRIRAEREAGCTGTDIAARYGLGSSTIYSILNRKTWRHV